MAQHEDEFDDDTSAPMPNLRDIDGTAIKPATGAQHLLLRIKFLQSKIVQDEAVLVELADRLKVGRTDPAAYQAQSASVKARMEGVRALLCKLESEKHRPRT